MKIFTSHEFAMKCCLTNFLGSKTKKPFLWAMKPFVGHEKFMLP